MLAVGGFATTALSRAAARPRAVRAPRAVSASAPGAGTGGGRFAKRECGRGDRVVARGKKEDAAKRALMGALGGSADILKENDGDGGWFGGGGFGGFGRRGGGGDGSFGDRIRTMGAFGVFVALLAIFALFKPVTAILVNLVYYLLKLPTGHEPGAVPVAAPVAAVAADADIIARYGADDDEDEDDEDDE